MVKTLGRARRGRIRSFTASLPRLGVIAVAGLAIFHANGIADARTVEYNISQDTASIQFDTHILKIIPFDGAFTRFTGHVQLDPDQLDSLRIDVVVDDGKMKAPYNGAKTLQSAAYFDQEQFPTIRFHSDSVQILSDNHFTIAGRLTIRGVSHPQTLKGTLTRIMVDGMPAVHIAARSQIERSDFGMVADQSFIANRVTLNISTTLRDP